MPSWGSGLASALTQGAVGYGEQQDVNRRELLALAARRRQEQIAAQREAREAERDGLLNGLTRAQTDRALRPEDPPAPRNIDPLSPEGIAAHRAKREIDRSLPLRDPVDRSGEQDQRSRRRWILDRTLDLQKPQTIKRGGVDTTVPGLSREEAVRQANEEWGAVAGDGSPTPPPRNVGNPGGRSALRGGTAPASPTRTTAGAGGTDNVPQGRKKVATPQDLAMAQRDPEFKKWLRDQGFEVP